MTTSLASYIIIILGLIIAFIGILGVIRFEKQKYGTYMILHSAGMIDALSSLLIIVGIMFNAPNLQIILKLAVFLLLLWFNSLLSTYIMINYQDE